MKRLGRAVSELVLLAVFLSLCCVYASQAWDLWLGR